MLTYLRADNYKSLVNLSLSFSQFGVLVGRNGTGKTAVYEVLKGIRDLLAGAKVADCFPTSTLTRFESRDSQKFTIQAKLAVGATDVNLEYDIVITHDRVRNIPMIESEVVTDISTNHILFRYVYNVVHLYRNDGSEGAQFPFGKSRSFLSEIIPRHENEILVDFRNWVQRMVLVRPDPRQMGWVTTIDGELESPDESGSRYADWLAFLLQENPKPMYSLFEDLRDCLPSFDSLGLERLGNLKRSYLEFNSGLQQWRILGAELSDGQKMLVFLYTLARSARNQLVFIDEPDNYIGLTEMQPFLALIREVFSGEEGQLLVISHHPETIDYLAADSALIFEIDGGVTTIRDVSEIPGLKGQTVSQYFFDLA